MIIENGRLVWNQILTETVLFFHWNVCKVIASKQFLTNITVCILKNRKVCFFRIHLYAQTSVWTMLTRCDLSSRMQLKMSTTPSFSAMSSMMSTAMKQPVLPAPALHRQKYSHKMYYIYWINVMLLWQWVTL